MPRGHRGPQGQVVGHDLPEALHPKPSTRTRVSFEVGETIADTARVLSRYVDGIVARVFSHQDVMDLARHGTVPVINGLSDLLHPCQALADYFTLRERRGSLEGLKVAYVGDGNNVCHELMLGAVKRGMSISVASPKGYEPSPLMVKSAAREAQRGGTPAPEVTDDPMAAAVGAHVVYTDVWTSMGQEEQQSARADAFQGYMVTPDLMAVADPEAVFMHCLPAQRGEEVAAENRFHPQMALLALLLGPQS